MAIEKIYQISWKWFLFVNRIATKQISLYQVKEKWFRTKSDKSYASGHVRPPGIALLVIYLFICLIPAGLVPHTGHDHHSGHDHILESNPCHISIYHAGLEGGCDHKYHFTENNPPCPLCEVSLLPQITVDPVLWISQITPAIPFIISLAEEFVWHTIILQEDRGPPQNALIESRHT